MTGWNLPPGCTVADIDRAAGVDAPCEVCGKSLDACICPECPACGCVGDPGCYEEREEHSHGLTKTQAQIDSLRESTLDPLEIAREREYWDRVDSDRDRDEAAP